MRKIFCIIVGVFLLLFVLCGCGEAVTQSQSDLTYAAIYREAASLGYEGTLEEFLSLVKGSDGNGISDIKINSDGYLIVSYTKERQELNLGRIKGSDGISIVNAIINENGELLITMSNNPDTPINLGKIVGENGIDGMDGLNGIDGKDGINGTDGNNGLSAYEIYKKYYPNYNKTEREWILDLISGNLITRYNVTFHYYQGKEDETYEIIEGEKVSEPTTEKTNRDDYDFVCWRVGSKEGEVYNFNTPVEGNIELYAEYIQKRPTYVNKTLLGIENIKSNYFYTCGLSNDMREIRFEATDGKVEYEIRYTEQFGNTIIKQGTKTFSMTQTALTVNLSDLQGALDILYITIFYQNAKGQLLVYPA